MSGVTLHDVRFIEPEKTRNYLNVDYGALSWLLTKDHKRIAILYLFSVTLLFILGGFFAVVMRVELLTPEGDVLTSDTYNKFFTLHGIVMIFFFLIPAIPSVLGNFLLPVMPTFQGQVSEDDLIRLLAYVRTMGAEQPVATQVESAASALESRGAPQTTTNPQGNQP